MLNRRFADFAEFSEIGSKGTEQGLELALKAEHPRRIP